LKVGDLVRFDAPRRSPIRPRIGPSLVGLVVENSVSQSHQDPFIYVVTNLGETARWYEKDCTVISEAR